MNFSNKTQAAMHHKPSVPPFIEYFYLSLIFSAPATILLIRGSTSAILIFLSLFSIIYGLIKFQAKQCTIDIRNFRYYALASICFPLAIIIQQIYLDQWDLRALDAISRFTVAFILFLFLSNLDPKKLLRYFGWGCAGGAIGIFLWAIVFPQPQIWAATHRLGNYYTNPIPFGDIALLLGFLALITMQADERSSLPVFALRLFALFCGIYISYKSGSRGGWLAMPILVVIVLSQNRSILAKRAFYLLSSGIFVFVAFIFASPYAQHRFNDIFQNLSSFSSGNADTSVGLRLSLWRASVRLFFDNPLYGVGKGRLEPALHELAQSGLLIPQAVNQHAHSDIFSTMAEMGGIGLICLFILYFGLTFYFWKSRKSNVDLTKTAAYSGLAVATSTIIFGLTIDVLVPVMQVSFIALSCSVFLAVINHSRRNNESDILARE